MQLAPCLDEIVQVVFSVASGRASALQANVDPTQLAGAGKLEQVFLGNCQARGDSSGCEQIDRHIYVIAIGPRLEQVYVLPTE